MDAVAYIAAAREDMRRIAELHASVADNLARAEALTRHAFEHWNGIMRDSTRPCPPSELPDSKLGSALAKVRDFLRPAPGRPVDPEFDRVVEAHGLENARGSADLLVGAGLAVDAVWQSLRRTRPRPAAPWAERAE